MFCHGGKGVFGNDDIFQFLTRFEGDIALEVDYSDNANLLTGHNQSAVGNL